MTKLYSKNVWVDEVLAGNERYNILEDGGAAFKNTMQIALSTAVTQAGTFADATKMNNLENGLDAVDTRLNTLNNAFTLSGTVSAGLTLTSAGDVYTAKATYTPTWSSSGTQPVLGNGSLSGHYTKIGKLVQFAVSLTMGSTTTYGTGAYSFALPFTASAIGNAVIPAYILDTGTRMYQGLGVINVGAAVIAMYDGLTNMDPTHPHTWAVGDILQFSGAFESV